MQEVMQAAGTLLLLYSAEQPLVSAAMVRQGLIPKDEEGAKAGLLQRLVHSWPERSGASVQCLCLVEMAVSNPCQRMD